MSLTLLVSTSEKVLKKALLIAAHTPDALDKGAVRRQAEALAKAAGKRPVEVEVREKGKPKARYRIERKKREEPKEAEER